MSRGSENPLVEELRQARAEFLEAWNAIPPAAREQQPADGGWSAVQVLRHVARSLGQVARVAEGLWDGRPDTLPSLDSVSGIAGRLDHFRIEDRSRRYRAPRFTEPEEGRSVEDCWSWMAKGLQRMEHLAVECLWTDPEPLQAAHPLLGSMDLHQWILFAGKHERRHAAQLRELARHSGE